MESERRNARNRERLNRHRSSADKKTKDLENEMNTANDLNSDPKSVAAWVARPSTLRTTFTDSMARCGF